MNYGDERISVRIDKTTKFFFKAEAKARNMSFSKYLKKAAAFYGSLDPDFVEAVEKESKEMGLRTGDFMQAMIMNQLAMHSAFRLTFGVQGHAMQRPFQRDVDGKLIRGQELLEKLLGQYLELYDDFRRKTERADRDQKAFKISAESVQNVIAQQASV